MRLVKPHPVTMLALLVFVAFAAHKWVESGGFVWGGITIFWVVLTFNYLTDQRRKR